MLYVRAYVEEYRGVVHVGLWCGLYGGICVFRAQSGRCGVWILISLGSFEFGIEKEGNCDIVPHGS